MNQELTKEIRSLEEKLIGSVLEAIRKLGTSVQA